MEMQVSDLRRAWDLAASVVKRNPTVSIDSNCLLRCSGGVCTVVGTDREVWSAGSFPHDGDLMCALDASRTQRFLSSLHNGSVEVSNGGNKMKLAATASKIEMPTVDPESFLSAPASSPDGFDIDCDALKALIKHASFANDDDATHSGSIVGGVNLELVDGICYASGTNVSVVSVSQCPVEGSDFGTRLPDKAARVLVQRLGSGACRVSKSVDTEAAVFSWEGGQLATRLLEGDPSRIRKLSSRVGQPSEWVSVPAPSFQTAVERSTIAQTPESNGLSLVIGDGKMKLSCVTEFGESEAEIPVATELEIDRQYDSRFLLGMARTATDQIEIGFVDEARAMIAKFGGCMVLIAGMAKE